MTRAPSALLVLTALALGLAAACTTGRGGDGPLDDPGRFTVQVRNQDGAGSTLRIYVAVSNESPKLLGNMVGSDASFAFVPGRPRAQHRLVARSQGRERERTVSRPFVPEGSSGVFWDVATNHLMLR